MLKTLMACFYLLSVILLGTNCAFGQNVDAPGRDLGTPDKARKLTFDFGSGSVAQGSIRVTGENRYSEESGYGLDLETAATSVETVQSDAYLADALTSEEPFFFSVRVPEGNYRVAVTFCGGKAGSKQTVKAESRRLMLWDVAVPAGEVRTESFIVNVRNSSLEDGGRVGLKTREKDALHWDRKLTLEFNGDHPAVCGIEITWANDATGVYLLGDSTVTDQPSEPWNSWGQMLTSCFGSDVFIANHAESGESLKGALRARRVQKVIESLKPGDYVFVQFGHNDMKDKAEGALELFRDNLIMLAKDVRAKAAIPVFVTSVERKAGVKSLTLTDYPHTMREVAKEHHVDLIDLQALSVELYRALGDQLDAAFQDGSHHNAYGSYLVARCVEKGIRSQLPELAKHLRADLRPFDITQPIRPSEFSVPVSPSRDLTKPDGS